MKTIRPTLLFLLLTSTVAFASVKFALWKVKEQAYAVKFTSNRADGSFKGLKASINFDEANPSVAKITATINTNTAETGNGLKNKHVKQALNAEKYPLIKFESTAVSKKGTSYEASGNLTVNGQTKAIKMPFQFIKNGDDATFNSQFSILTEDYKIEKWGSPKTVNIEISVPVTK